MDRMVKIIVLAVRSARDGVEYDVKAGAGCPFCGERVRVRNTLPWLGDARKRYHKCENPQCALCVMDESITSWQEK